MPSLTRREFLKLSGAALAGTALPPLPPRDQAARAGGRLGRIAEWSVRVHTEPDLRAPTVRYHRRDDVIAYFEEVEAEGRNPRNPIWFRVIGGYIYSSDHSVPSDVSLADYQRLLALVREAWPPL